MPSLIPGFEYDIFISYRQKDNKGDRWVSEFVEALKTEIEATFKEDISIYFDENPHDSLLETHNVDKSLEGKLKCLIFIPILSQTYCDPRSYAWQHEFLTFNKIAEKDQFGRDVKLRNGNVTSRILPIRIHELDPDDVKLFEKETGSVMRAMDFVFRTSSGVNRPLRANEDHPNDNLNRTFYRDQINKVANAIKEIILGLKTEAASLTKGKTQQEALKEVKNAMSREEQDKPVKSLKWKQLSSYIIGAVVLIIAVILAYPKIFQRDKLESLRSSDGRISIAVMPFQNLTNDTLKNSWQDWIQDNLIASLSNSKELRVRQTQSINTLLQSQGLYDYASLTPSSASTISKKLDADVFICGSVKQSVGIVRINAQLINSNSEEVFKSFQIDGITSRILQMIDSLSIMVKDFLEVSKLKNEGPQNLQDMLASCNSPEAYRYFIAGKKAFEKRDYPTVINMLSKAIEIDSSFFYAPILLAQAYRNAGMYEQAKKIVLKQYIKRDRMPMQLKIYTNWIYAECFETTYEEIKYLLQLLEIDDQSPDYHYLLGLKYLNLDNFDKAIYELDKALDINYKWGSKPWWVHNYTALGYAYYKTGQHKKEKRLYKKAEQDFPDDPDLIYRQAILSLSEGDKVEANQHIDRLISIHKEDSWSEADIKSELGWIYYEANILDKAEAYFRQALQLQPDNPDMLNNLSWLLIDKDRNVNEGVELADKALTLSPDLSPGNYYLLHTKGWGLYKQSKSKEALEILEKSWDLKPMYDHQLYLHIEEAKNAIANKK
jgi:tetratricopeptide (TPR) repeat protein